MIVTGTRLSKRTPRLPLPKLSVLRLVCPRAYVSTAELLLSRHASDQVHNGEALLRAAGAGS